MTGSNRTRLNAALIAKYPITGQRMFLRAPNETDMLLRNSNTGAFELYDISKNAITAAGPMGGVGLERSISGVAATAAASGPPSTQLRDLAVEPAGTISQLTQAMAGFAPSAGAAGASSPLDQTPAAAANTTGLLAAANHPQAIS
jgi:hypothetical protein